jgi:hypothetical protein
LLATEAVGTTSTASTTTVAAALFAEAGGGTTDTDFLGLCAGTVHHFLNASGNPAAAVLEDAVYQILEGSLGLW